MKKHTITIDDYNYKDFGTIKIGNEFVFINNGKKKKNIKGYTISEGHRYLYLPYHPNAKPNGYYAEHRFVMEQSIGRLLKSGEVVHHIDKNGLNNSQDNLLLTNPSEHGKIHYSSEKMIEGRRKKYKDGWNPDISGDKNPNWRGGKVVRVCENPKCNESWLCFPCRYNRKKYCSKLCRTH